MDLLSPLHILALLAVALLIFGPKRLPEIGAGLGKTIRNFKASMSGQEPPQEPEAPKTQPQE